MDRQNLTTTKKAPKKKTIPGGKAAINAKRKYEILGEKGGKQEGRREQGSE